MANHNKEKYLQFNSSTYRQDDSYQILDNMNKPKLDFQAQVQDIKDMEDEHIIAKELYQMINNMRSLIIIMV